VTALLADLTRDSVRTKSMAMVGGSIGLMFALSLVASPVLNSLIGLPGLFTFTGLLALTGIAVVVWAVPAEPPRQAALSRIGMLGGLMQVLRDPALLRMNLGVFILHAVQMAMWLALPTLLVKAGLAKEHHWWIYLPAVLGSFVVMGMSLFPLEKRGYLRAIFLLAIGTVAWVQIGLLGVAGSLVDSAPAMRLACLALLLFLFFCGFNVLEASQPSLVSKLSPAHTRGAAMGLYNTAMSLGLFAGGALGGLILKTHGPTGLFMAGSVMMGVWLVIAWPMRQPGSSAVNPSNDQVSA
jgi:predicted MFS family arabinose efflux permease